MSRNNGPIPIPAHSQYPNGKPTIEHFACGHAREFVLGAIFTPKHVQTHYARTLMPSQAYHLFTNGSCGEQACTKSDLGNCSEIDNTVPIAPYNGTEHLKLQRKYAQYRFDLAQVAVSLSQIHPDCLRPFWEIGVPWVSRLFDLFPGCLHSNALLNEDAMQSKDKDVQTLLSRVFQQEDDRTPSFAIDYMCRLGHMALNELNNELRWLTSYVFQLKRCANAMESNLADEAKERRLIEIHPDLGDERIIHHLRAHRYHHAEKAFALDLHPWGPLHDWHQICRQGAMDSLAQSKLDDPPVPVAKPTASLKRKRGELPRLTITLPPDLWTLDVNQAQNDELRLSHLRNFQWSSAPSGLRFRESAPLTPLGIVSPRTARPVQPRAQPPWREVLENKPAALAVHGRDPCPERVFSPRTLMTRRTAASAELKVQRQLRASERNEKWTYGFRWVPSYAHLTTFHSSVAPDYGWWSRRRS